MYVAVFLSVIVHFVAPIAFLMHKVSTFHVSYLRIDWFWNKKTSV